MWQQNAILGNNRHYAKHTSKTLAQPEKHPYLCGG